MTTVVAHHEGQISEPRGGGGGGGVVSKDVALKTDQPMDKPNSVQQLSLS